MRSEVRLRPLETSLSSPSSSRPKVEGGPFRSSQVQRRRGCAAWAATNSGQEVSRSSFQFPCYLITHTFRACQISGQNHHRRHHRLQVRPPLRMCLTPTRKKNYSYEPSRGVPSGYAPTHPVGRGVCGAASMGCLRICWGTFCRRGRTRAGGAAAGGVRAGRKEECIHGKRQEKSGS